MTVFFLTDGEDGNRDATTFVADHLKQQIVKREIQSKFCVMGIGSEHDSQFLDKISQTGNEQGIYVSISQDGTNST